MSARTLEDWLRWQETLHPRAVDLGLERCQTVAARMGWEAPDFALVTVAGTNGKGSTVALLESMLEAAGYRTGAYTSPHLLRYNERIRVRGTPVADRTIGSAFERVEAARGAVSLTYFEFGTLAAMEVFRRVGLDAVVLEVGLGGRLDAVNLFDADVAVITAIDLDHTEWLGPDRESIGREKAGILRAGRPAICGDPGPPASVFEAAARVGAPLSLLGRDFRAVRQAASWDWEGASRCLRGLPLPALAGEFQLRNAAAAIAALEALAPGVVVERAAIERGLESVRLAGRLQVIEAPFERILDVAHNPQAVGELATFLRSRSCAGRTHALFAMLADKDIRGAVCAIAPVVDLWHVAGLPGPRGLPAEAIAARVAEASAAVPVQTYAWVEAAYRALLDRLRPPDRLVVFGSFLTVAGALRVETERRSRETLSPGVSG
jgi:dihydrofolate synthase/folylpolyglutamate synthase